MHQSIPSKDSLDHLRVACLPFNLYESVVWLTDMYYPDLDTGVSTGVSIGVRGGRTGESVDSGTQPDPRSNTHSVNVTPELIKYLLERNRKGIETYGTPLQTFNGRDSLKDALDEALDLCQYLIQSITERDHIITGEHIKCIEGE